jgi:hypothetical protein
MVGQIAGVFGWMFGGELGVVDEEMKESRHVIERTGKVS